MAEHSKIEWTDATWPIVAGCEFVSPECTNCYALNDSWRMAHHPNPKIHNPFFGTVDKTEKRHLVWSGIVRPLPMRLGWPLRWRRPRRIFVCNLADLFHPKVPFEFIAAAFGVMSLAHWHTYQVLTKHPARMLAFFNWLVDVSGAMPEDVYCENEALHHVTLRRRGMQIRPAVPGWPLPNAHLGVTAGDQKRADERIPALLRCPAARHFLSYEPAIGELDLRKVGMHNAGTSGLGERWTYIDALDGRRYVGDYKAGAPGHPYVAAGPDSILPHLDWVIAGGESGPRARAPDPDWFRKVRDDCAAAGVPFHFKQWGAWHPCETEVIPAPRSEGGGRNLYPHDEDLDLGERGYQVIELHGKEFFRAGKKLAGRRLDGVEHDGRPE